MYKYSKLYNLGSHIYLMFFFNEVYARWKATKRSISSLISLDRLLHWRKEECLREVVYATVGVNFWGYWRIVRLWKEKGMERIPLPRSHSNKRISERVCYKLIRSSLSLASNKFRLESIMSFFSYMCSLLIMDFS